MEFLLLRYGIDTESQTSSFQLEAAYNTVRNES